MPAFGIPRRGPAARHVQPAGRTRGPAPRCVSGRASASRGTPRHGQRHVPAGRRLDPGLDPGRTPNEAPHPLSPDPGDRTQHGQRCQQEQLRLLLLPASSTFRHSDGRFNHLCFGGLNLFLCFRCWRRRKKGVFDGRPARNWWLGDAAARNERRAFYRTAICRARVSHSAAVTLTHTHTDAHTRTHWCRCC